jgi:DNA-binding CsgD family transcriptional regulator
MREFEVRLSRREEQCLYFSVQDLSLEEIAEKMHVSYDSVKRYRRYLLRKLACKTMSAAVFRAVSLNLVRFN